MAALFLLLATVGGVVVGDLVLENTSVDDISVFNHTIHGVSEGLLLAMAAALGLVVGLLVVLSAGTTRTRRARRKRLRAAERDLNRQVAELQRDNARLRRELARRDRPAPSSRRARRTGRPRIHPMGRCDPRPRGRRPVPTVGAPLRAPLRGSQARRPAP